MKILKEHTEWWENHDIRFQPIMTDHSEHTEQYNTPVLDHQHTDDMTEWNTTQND